MNFAVSDLPYSIAYSKPWSLVLWVIFMICKKYLFGHSDDQNILYIYIYGPSPQLLQILEFPKCREW